jgi:hypothetical protein
MADDANTAKYPKSAWVTVGIGLSVLLFSAVVAGATFQWGKDENAGFLLIALCLGSTLAFILLDLGLMLSRSHVTKNTDDKANSWNPNVRIWGIGPVLGITLGLLYLLGKLGKDVFAQSATADSAAFWQPFGLLAVILAALGLVLWAVVRICQID